MLKTVILILTLLISIPAFAFEPFFYGAWGANPDTIQKRELRELVSVDETSTEDFANVVILKYRAPVTKEVEIIIDYYFNDNELALVSWTLNMENINSEDAEALLENYKKQIVSKYNDTSAIEHNKNWYDENNRLKSQFKAILIQDNENAISLLSHYFINDSKWWCYVTFSNKNNVFNTENIKVFYDIWHTLNERQP